MGLILHHLNCGSTCPRGASLSGAFTDTVINHCLLVETNEGLVLIDTGMGTALAEDPVPKLGRMRTFIFGIKREGRQIYAAKDLIEGLGYRASDVRHIIPTHLDFDHCGDLADFPHAQVHVFQQEKKRALSPLNAVDKGRYLPHAFAHMPTWIEYDGTRGEPWFGFETVRELPGVDSDILLIPLFGHTVGHTGIAVRSRDGWVLHAGDAYYQRDELFGQVGQWGAMMGNLIHQDPQCARSNQVRLKTLIDEHPEVEVFCSHDPAECNCD